MNQMKNNFKVEVNKLDYLYDNAPSIIISITVLSFSVYMFYIFLVFMGINMPNKNGIYTIRGMKTINTSMPIVVLTTNVVTGDIQKYLDEGFDDYLAKSIEDTLLKTIMQKYSI